MSHPELNKQITIEHGKSGWIAHGYCNGIPFVAEGETRDEAHIAAIDLAAEMYVRRHA